MADASNTLGVQFPVPRSCHKLWRKLNFTEYQASPSILFRLQSKVMTHDVAELGQVLSCPTRLRMLLALGANQRTIGELASIARVNYSSASQHVGKLNEAGLVHVDPQGNRRVVSLAAREVRLRLVP